jgi:hypothetical protein
MIKPALIRLLCVFVCLFMLAGPALAFNPPIVAAMKMAGPDSWSSTNQLDNMKGS